MSNPRIVWGAKWVSESSLSGRREHLINEHCLPVLFRTRREARAYIKREYGYIAERADLRAEPHGWQMPRAVRVMVSCYP